MVVAFEVAWLRALLGLAGGKSVRESVRFYDGPFVVNLFLRELGSVELSLIHKEDIRSIVEANIENLLQEAISAAEDSLSACAGRNWSNTDTEALATLLKVAGQEGGSSRSGGAK